MKCEECRELLWIYLEWETMPEETAEIKAHLAECPECRKEAAKQMSIMESLRSLPEAEPPEGYHAELMRKIMAEAPAQEPAKPEPAVQDVQPNPTEWKVVRKTEILQKAKEKKEWEKKRRGRFKQWSLVAAAVLVIVAAGGINGIVRMRQEPLEAIQPVESFDESAAPRDVSPDAAEPHFEEGTEGAVPDEEAALDTGGGQRTAAQRDSRKEGQKSTGTGAGTDPNLSVQDMPPVQAKNVPTAASALPEPESAPQARSIAPVEPDLMTAYEMPMDLAVLPDTAEEEEAEETDGAETAETAQGDTVTLRTGNGDVYGSLSRAVARNAGFEETADTANGVLAMIPVENMDAFYAELQQIGEIEWQAQGQEQPGAAYRRVEILVEAE